VRPLPSTRTSPSEEFVDELTTAPPLEVLAAGAAAVALFDPPPLPHPAMSRAAVTATDPMIVGPASFIFQVPSDGEVLYLD
jgi:hypothetical protein